MEKIEVLVTTYNGEKYIREQLDSILNQTYSNIHIIISDDGSSDQTIEILKEYEKKEERITVYYQTSNLGCVRNFDFLLHKVTAPYYMLCDQDDIWLPEKIAASYQEMIDKNVDLVFGDLKVVDENLNIIYPSMFQYLKIDQMLKRYHDYRAIYMDNIVTGCTLLSKSKFLELIFPLPTESKYLIHDYWIALAVMINGTFSYLEKPYILYRQHGNNIVGTERKSTKFKKFEQVRDLFITVKKERFREFIHHDRIFPEEIKEKNNRALEYYTEIEHKKYINLKQLSVFHELYRLKGIKLYLVNFVILNLPILGRLIFKIRYLILKLMGKR